MKIEGNFLQRSPDRWAHLKLELLMISFYQPLNCLFIQVSANPYKCSSGISFLRRTYENYKHLLSGWQEDLVQLRYSTTFLKFSKAIFTDKSRFDVKENKTKNPQQNQSTNQTKNSCLVDKDINKIFVLFKVQKTLKISGRLNKCKNYF